ncbi:MAG: hypothetical protein QN178_00725 [Armatimonadota bacterium]|nr:hypothetical protein [Armatimonadota bacterium]
MGSYKADVAHQPGDALAAAPHPQRPQFGVHPRGPVGPPAAREDRLDLLLQHRVCPRAR